MAGALWTSYDASVPAIWVEAMKKPSRAGGKPAKARRHNRAVKPKGRSPPKTMPRRGSAPAGQETEVARLTRELHEALERETATSEVLRVISTSPSELESIFEAILANATRICEAKFGNLWLREGDNVRIAATHGAPSAYREYLKSEPVVVPAPGSALARVLTNRQVVQIEDITEVSTHDMKVRLATIKLAKARSLIGVPLVKENEVIGAIAIYRQEVRPFSEKQVELLKSFAAQAVIAIENARLLNELRQRTNDLGERTAHLTESLEQQTATSEVLQVISSSPGELEPVFASMLEKAVRICDATFGNIYRWDGEALHLLAAHNTPPALLEARRHLPRRAATSFLRRMLATKIADHVADLTATKEYTEERLPGAVSAVELGGVRTFLAVPMLHENKLIGSFSLYRQEVRPFTDKQIALVTNFAAQAVIAIENARLLNVLRQRTNDLSQRTTDLTQALEQQTATSDVLKVISSSPGDLQPVFDIMLANATRLCEASHGHVWIFDGELGYAVAVRGDAPYHH